MNIENNKWENVQVFPHAAGAAEFSAGMRGGINSGVVPLGKGDSETLVVPLDAILSTRVDVIKIDVGGYEGDVLQ